MSSLKLVLVTGAVAAAGLVAAPAATAQPPANASCVGALSSVAGQTGVRSEFAPAPGAEVAALAQQHGDFAYCFAVFNGG